MPLWPLSFVAFAPLFFALDRERVGGWRAIGLGWVCGVAAQAGGTYWLVGTLARFSGHSLPVCVALALAVWLYEGGRVAVFAWVLWRVRARGRDALWVAPFAWAGVECAYPLLFPNQLGASLHAVPVLVQIADLGGTTLVSMLVVFVSAALYALGRSVLEGGPLPRARVAAALVALVATLVYGDVRMRAIDARAAAAPKLRVGLVQANLGNRENRAGRQLGASRRLERSARPDLIVWPESAVPGALDADAGEVGELVAGLATPILLGALTLKVHGEAPGLYNSALLVGAGGAVLGRYDKLRLLPFGEYVPFDERVPWLHRLVPNASRLRAGRSERPVRLGAARIATLVCYEDLLPALVRDLVRAGNPQLFVNLTNDTWFGDTTEPWIHLALAKLRAVEQRRVLVRATNSGITAIVDAVGGVVARAPPFRSATLVAAVPLLDGFTPYARFGDWPGRLGIALTALLLVAPARRARGRLPDAAR